MHPFKTAKKVAKTTVKAIMAVPFIIKFVAVFSLASILVNIFDFAIEIFTANNTSENMYSTLEVEDMKSLVEIKKSEDDSGYYLDFVSDFDEKVEKIINDANRGAGFHNLPDDEEFIKKLIKAEVITQFPDLGGNIPDGSEGFQGSIDVRRVTPNKQIGSIDDNPGRGETTTLEPEITYDTVNANTSSEEKVKTWVEGQTLLIKSEAIVYEQEESQLNPGADTGHWYEKRKEGIKDIITIPAGVEVTYTGTYKNSTNALSKETVVYVEVKRNDLTGYVKANLLIEKEEEEQKINSENEENNKEVTSRANDRGQNEAIGREGEEYTIAIAAGHNNTDDTGARSGDLIEEELTIKTAEKVEDLLSEYSNVRVVQVGSTSENPSGVKVSERTTLARNEDPDLCIQIHFNAGGSSGVEAIYKEGDGISQQLAEFLSDSIATSMGLTDRGAGPDVEKCAVGSLGIIENAANTGFPSVVTEGGFIDGEPDATLLKGDGIDKYAEGIVEGIKKYLVADHSGYTSTSIERETSQESINSKVYNLKYVEPETLEDLILSANGGNQNAKDQILRVFTLDDENNLVTTTWEVREGGITYKKNASMNFKTSLEKYTMPFEYLLYFYIDTNEKDFSEKLTEEVFNTEIVIAVQDNVTTVKTTEITVEWQESTDSNHAYGEREVNREVTITETCTPKIEITYADTWFVKFYKENSYSSQALDWQEGEEEKELDIKGKVTMTPSESETGEELIASDTVETTDQNGNTSSYSYWRYQKTKTSTDTMTIQYDSGESTIEGNENKFVEAYQSCKMQNWIRESYLFQILENNEKTVNLLDLTKYLMYKATSISYGVVEFDFSEFDLAAFQGIGGIYGGTIQEKVWFAILDAGYSEYAAAGVLGNIEAESGFNAGVIEGGSGIGAGLCQWSYGRRTQLEAYAASKGVDWTDENTQVEFLIGEITPGGGANGYASYQLMNYHGYSPTDWENADSPTNAAIAFCWTFERPGIPRMDVRTEAAERYYNEFHGKQRTAGGSLLQAADVVAQYVESNGYIYRGTGSTNYTFPIASSSAKTISCSSYIQEVLLQAGYTQCAGGEKLWARTNSAASKADFDGLGIPIEIITDLNQIQPGDILQYTTGYHVVLAYSVSGDNIQIKGVPEVLSPNAGGPYQGYGANGVTRTRAFLQGKGCYIVRIKR